MYAWKNLQYVIDFNFSIWGGMRGRLGTTITSNAYTDGTSFYEDDAINVFPHTYSK